ncbi:mannitol-1-phosphate 5-dehydrogenase [Sinomonas sp. ASV322]|uniref:mannitol-1-phosphate 5-dehydrogenase n=1 Tax=Sinomonas sp. ASV322 TaxID=3041920 RepID=UPI0027DE2FB9|nr:mannitol-1-phosphate 5-dehydrogenase [Sinomonas sp. ASV322]MDQ4501633.1 mannitol-1-phosphate 5-dehydrogenase [Sinomonas sp. ASV322]
MSAQPEATDPSTQPEAPGTGSDSKSAVHFGAGNIGRGFVGLLLHEAGYDLVFADVAAPLIDALKATPSYTVHEVGEGGRDHVVDRYAAVNSATDEAELVERIARADVVTTAVGPNILKFVAPVIARGVAARPEAAPRLAVMACENAINATDLLETEVRAAARAEGTSDADVDAKALFANTAVDRIVPAQAPGGGLDVRVEPYFEWAIERGPFGGEAPEIPGVTWVESLGPYIERKLFTVNTGHASAAYFGRGAGKEKIADAIADPEIRAKVEAVLAETKALLVAKYGFSPEDQESYIRKILGRFANAELPDTVDRVGRAPLRKLSRHERFVGPAAELAERGLAADALLEAMGAALRFDAADDDEAQRLQATLAGDGADAAVAEELTGLEPGHPLYGAVVGLVADARQGRG